MTDIEILGRITKILLPILGKPNISKTTTERGVVLHKTTGWKISGIKNFIKVYEAMEKAEISVGHLDRFQFDFDFVIPADWRMESFYMSDDPQVWHQVNAQKNAKSAALKAKRKANLEKNPWSENDKIREVNTRVSGECSLHHHLDDYSYEIPGVVDGYCLRCEALKQKRGLPNRLHTLSTKSDNWHSKLVSCPKCIAEKEFNEKYVARNNQHQTHP